VAEGVRPVSRADQQVVCREYQAKDRKSLLALHNRVFPPVTLEYWREWDKQDVTASVALIGNEVVGCVPLHIRSFVVRPGVTVQAAVEYSVCVREDLRSRGIGSRLMNCAASFLRGRVEVMLVHRGGELSPGYRYYARNHHYDMVYIRQWRWRAPAPKPTPNVGMHDIAEMYRREAQVIEVFNSCFGQFGGYPQRRPGDYRGIPYNPNWAEIKHDWRFLELSRGGELIGYLLLGVERRSKRWQVMEWATRDGNLGIAGVLTDHAATLTPDASLSLPLTGHDPLRSEMVSRGAVPTARSKSSMMIMAKAFDPARLARAVWDPSVELPETEVWVWSPASEACIYSGPGEARRRIVLEMKDDILTRLLLSRLDLGEAARQELVTTMGATDRDLALIANALPFCPWVHQGVDYI